GSIVKAKRLKVQLGGIIQPTLREPQVRQVSICECDDLAAGIVDGFWITGTPRQLCCSHPVLQIGRGLGPVFGSLSCCWGPLWSRSLRHASHGSAHSSAEDPG